MIMQWLIKVVLSRSYFGETAAEVGRVRIAGKIGMHECSKIHVENLLLFARTCLFRTRRWLCANGSEFLIASSSARRGFCPLCAKTPLS